jgi:hypothetical protein
MRLIFIGTLTAIGLAMSLATSSGAFAAAIAPVGAAPGAAEAMPAYYYGYHRHYRHCWWRYGRRICRW